MDSLPLVNYNIFYWIARGKRALYAPWMDPEDFEFLSGWILRKGGSLIDWAFPLFCCTFLGFLNFWLLGYPPDGRFHTPCHDCRHIEFTPTFIFHPNISWIQRDTFLRKIADIARWDNAEVKLRLTFRESIPEKHQPCCTMGNIKLSHAVSRQLQRLDTPPFATV